MAPPPFTPAPDIARRIGINGIGLMTWLVSKAESAVDVPGGFCASGTVHDLCKEVGWSSGKWSAETKALQGAGLIVVDRGLRLGRNGGSTSNRYFLTHHPSLVVPGGPVGNSRFRDAYLRDLKNRDPERGVDKDIHRGGRHLVSADSPDEEGPPGQFDISNNEISSKNDTSVVDFRSNQQQQDLEGVKNETPAPKFVTRALASVGWVGPPPAVADVEILVAVCIHLSGQRGRFTNPAGFLKRLIDNDALIGFAMTERLPIVTSDDAEASTSMPHEEYTRNCINYPGWERAVTTEAARRVQMLGIPLSMALIRSVASEIPINEADSG